jgi:hypothetical protein
MLERSGSSFKGKSSDTQGVEYEFSARITGNSAVGRLVIVASDDGMFDMRGAYTRRIFRDRRPCLWQTIHLTLVKLAVRAGEPPGVWYGIALGIEDLAPILASHESWDLDLRIVDALE